MKILTADEMRALEKQADASGVSYHDMMERAGLAVAQAIRAARDAKEHPRVAVLVNPGNNGGDGLVAARHLAKWGYQVAVYLAKARPPDDENLALAAQAGAHIVVGDNDAKLALFRRMVAECDIFVDALLGTGVSRPIEGRFRDILLLAAEQVALRKGAAPRFGNFGGVAWPKEPPEPAPSAAPYIVAVDLPSGLNADTGALDPAALPADLTVTFAFPKRGHFLFPGAGAVGRLAVADIGIRDEWAADIPLNLMTPKWVAERLPRRPLDAHKGTFGRALIVAGSVNYTGAAGLAAAAAVRVGAGLVTLCAGASVRPVVASLSPEVTYLVLPEEVGVLSEAGAPLVLQEMPRAEALLVGPGLGQDDTTRRLVWAVLGLGAARRTRIGFTEREESPPPPPPCPIVIDADGLNALAGLEDWHERVAAPCILTPHPGEMARLLRCSTAEVQADRIGVATRAAQHWGKVVILKGAHTVVAMPDGATFVCPFANPALATAGTGDVLAGILVGLLAQGMTPPDAAVAGVYVHALAGELAARRTGPSGLAAGDLLAHIPAAVARLRGMVVSAA
ncbi:MAG: bifunctional ADP-dependent NAD(P)H-hydrate dehydratase/NAD(P)H-hydrate epimerase [Anaerolineales bacterium]